MSKANTVPVVRAAAATVNVPEEKNKKLKVIRDNKGQVTGMEEK